MIDAGGQTYNPVADFCVVKFSEDSSTSLIPNSDFYTGLSGTPLYGLDFAIIKIRSYDDYLKNLAKTTSNYEVCNTPANLGDEVVVLGYPSVGSSTGITAENQFTKIENANEIDYSYTVPNPSLTDLTEYIYELTFTDKAGNEVTAANRFTVMIGAPNDPTVTLLDSGQNPTSDEIEEINIGGITSNYIFSNRFDLTTPTDKGFILNFENEPSVNLEHVYFRGSEIIGNCEILEFIRVLTNSVPFSFLSE